MRGWTRAWLQRELGVVSGHESGAKLLFRVTPGSGGVPPCYFGVVSSVPVEGSVLSSVTGLCVSRVGANSVDLKWCNPTGATHCVGRVVVNGDVANARQLEHIADQTLVVDGLEAGDVITATISAVCGDVVEPAGAVITTATLVAPRNLELVRGHRGAGPKQAILSWDAVPGASCYRVEHRGGVSGSFAPLVGSEDGVVAGTSVELPPSVFRSEQLHAFRVFAGVKSSEGPGSERCFEPDAMVPVSCTLRASGARGWLRLVGRGFASSGRSWRGRNRVG